MKQRLYLIMMVAMTIMPAVSMAQQYIGTSGLLHIPSAEMNHEGDARIGAHWIDQHMLPDTGFLAASANGTDKYSSFGYYASITPFEWIEISLTCTERKDFVDGPFVRKDRYASIKVRPLTEGKYWPAVALGFNDVGTTAFNPDQTDVQLYFTNIYAAATKHFDLGGNELGVTMAYRHFFRGYNDKWSGLVGGVTFRPAFFPQGRAIVEYTGNELLVGADALLWQHLLLQVGMKDFKYFNFGLCFQINLLGKKYRY